MKKPLVLGLCAVAVLAVAMVICFKVADNDPSGFLGFWVPEYPLFFANYENCIYLLPSAADTDDREGWGVAGHEVGHALGLGHITDVRMIMNPSHAPGLEAPGLMKRFSEGEQATMRGSQRLIDACH